jgi:predicted HTH domain antitoxin
MKLALTEEELLIFINELKDCGSVVFTTDFESKLSAIILKEFLQHLMTRHIKMKETHKVSIDDRTLVVLNYVMPQIQSNGDAYAYTVTADIYKQINQACLSI